MLTAAEVATLLKVSPAWVYRHKIALGGFQPEHGAAIRFSENRIVKLKEGNHAIPNENREMARQAYDSRRGENESFPDKGRSQKVGSRASGRRVGKRKFPDPHGLLD
jgi:hypothetical protein